MDEPIVESVKAESLVGDRVLITVASEQYLRECFTISQEQMIELYEQLKFLVDPRQ